MQRHLPRRDPQFWRGDDGKIGALAGKVAGSAEIFNFAGPQAERTASTCSPCTTASRSPISSATSDKHNEANGEDNRDGHNNNSSWNCGVEGPTDDETILDGAPARRAGAARDAVLLARHAADPAGRRDGPHAARQQQRLCAGQRDHLARLGGRRRRAGRLRRGGPRLPQGAPGADRTTSSSRGQEQARRARRRLAPSRRPRDDRGRLAAIRGASVLGMDLRTGATTVLVWFNRRAEAARAVLPEGHWAIGMQSDDKARVDVLAGHASCCRRARWSR